LYPDAAAEAIGPPDAVDATWPALLPLLDEVESETR
jgi:hypothetical protein